MSLGSVPPVPLPKLSHVCVFPVTVFLSEAGTHALETA